MELPDDVLVLVRAYAKPYFKYFREYNRALHVLEKEEWEGLKNKLRTGGESVVPMLLLYLDSFVELQKIQVIHWDYYRFHLMGRRLQQTNVLDELNKKCQDVHEKTNRVKSIYRKLVVIIYGNPLPECALYGSGLKIDKFFILSDSSITMELPKYVLPLVRAFAKPRMKFYREYKKGLAELGVVDWPAVRLKLCSCEAEQVIHAFQEFVRIWVVTNHMNAKYMQSGRPPHLIYDLSKQMQKRDLACRAFRILLVGEETILKYETFCLKYEDCDLYS